MDGIDGWMDELMNEPNKCLNEQNNSYITVNMSILDWSSKCNLLEPCPPMYLIK